MKAFQIWSSSIWAELAEAETENTPTKLKRLVVPSTLRLIHLEKQ